MYSTPFSYNVKIFKGIVFFRYFLHILIVCCFVAILKTKAAKGELSEASLVIFLVSSFGSKPSVGGKSTGEGK